MTKQLSLDDVLEVSKLIHSYERNVSDIKKLARTSYAEVVYQEGSPSYNVSVRIGPETMHAIIKHLRSKNDLIVSEIETKYQIQCTLIDQKINLVP